MSASGMRGIRALGMYPLGCRLRGGYVEWCGCCTFKIRDVVCGFGVL